MNHRRSLLTLTLIVGLTTGCETEDRPAASSGSPATPPSVTPIAAPPPQPPPRQAPSIFDQATAAATLADALDLVRPVMTDTDDELSPGAALMAAWATEHMRFSDVGVPKNETSFALVKKDSDAARGKRMCIKGRLIQIAKDELNGHAIFAGLLISGYSDIVNFVAVGSSGELVDRSRARFCGVVIGTYDYSNSGGGKGHAITVVGMFDLPENRQPAE